MTGHDDKQDTLVESIEDVYRALFEHGTAKPELPSREAKSYGLTKAEFDVQRHKIVKTIASIANTGADLGYIVFQGSAVRHEPVDGAVLDDAVHADVFPRIRFNLQQHHIDGRFIDVVRIPRSSARPHLMKNRGGELIIPFRGAANNVTAGWHELNEMYDAKTRSLLESIMHRAPEDREDPVGEQLSEIDWGGASTSTDAEFVFALVPTRAGTPLGALVGSSHAHAEFNAIFNQTINAANTTDWFAVNGDFISRPGDGEIELYQPAVDGHRIGTINIYDSGMIITRMWIIEPLIDGQKMFSFNHFVQALRASLEFAHGVYERANAANLALQLRCALSNTQDLDLWITPSANPRKVLRNVDVGRWLDLPKRPIEIVAAELQSRSTEIANQVGKALKTHYGH